MVTKYADDHVGMLYWAWGIIANVDEGNGMGASGPEYSNQTQEWRDAAAKWRDECLHPTLKAHMEAVDEDRT